MILPTHIFRVICKDDSIFGVDGGMCFGFVIDDFLDGLGEEETRLHIILHD